MKTLESPRTGLIGTQVAYVSPFGQCYRAYTVPHDPHTQRQERVRGFFGFTVRGWNGSLTELQRQRWEAAAQQAPSHPSLNQYSHLSGQLLWIKINNTLRCLGQTPADDPPAPVFFGPSPAKDLVIDYDSEGAVRLQLNLGPATEDLMVFGQAPCSQGRMKLRRVYFLGLLSLATEGPRDLSMLYTARFGQPGPGQKVFIVTSQVKNGWRGLDSVFSAIVPALPPPAEQAIIPGTAAKGALPQVMPKASQAPS